MQIWVKYFSKYRANEKLHRPLGEVVIYQSSITSQILEFFLLKSYDFSFDGVTAIVMAEFKGVA